VAAIYRFGITRILNSILDLAGRNVNDQLGELQRVARAFEAAFGH
jgi:hypothetical protein